MIELRQIKVAYDHVVFDDAHVCFDKGRVHYLVGESGCGKTTLLNQLGLLSTSCCEYLFDGISIENLSCDKKAQIRREKIGYVFQESNLIEGFTVYDHIQFIAHFSGYDITHEEICEWIEKVRLTPYQDQYVEHLSGGQKQRVAIASAFAKRPRLLLLDEPTAHLDKENVIIIKEILEALSKEDVIIVVATHDVDLYQSQHTYIIKDHQIVYQDIPYQSLTIQPVKRTPHVMKQSIRFYNQKRRKKSSLYTTLMTTVILIIAVTTQMYMSLYSTTMNDLMNNSFGEIRVYYGVSKLQVYQQLTTPLSLTTISRIKQLDTIKSASAFYEMSGTLNDMSVVIQSYSHDLSSKTSQTFNDSPILVSHSLYEKIKDNQVMELNEEVIQIGGVLDKQMMNRYSDNGENIVYVPTDYFDNDDIYMLLIQVDPHEDIYEVCESIQRIDSDLTIYSPVGLEQLGTFNKNIVEKLSYFSLFVLGMVVFFMIYDRLQDILSQKREIALLKANGSSSLQMTKILLLRQVKEVLLLDGLVCLTMVIFCIVFNYYQVILKMVFFLLCMNMMMLFVPIIIGLLLINKKEVVDLLSE